MKRYFKLVEISQYDEDKLFNLHNQLSENVCNKCGDMLMSTFGIPNQRMEDWDEYEYKCDLENIKIYKCTDSDCDQFYIVFENGETKYL